MAITEGQIPAALAAAEGLDPYVNDLVMLLRQAKELSDKGWQVNIGSRSPIILTVSPAQKAALVAEYDNLKAKLTAQYQQLP